MASEKKLISEPEDCRPGPSKVQHSSGPTTIESISDKELLSIFSLLPLYDLLHSVELVNQRWRWVALKSCFDRTCLSLLQAPAYRDHLVDMTRYWFFTDYTTRVAFERYCVRVTKEVNEAGVQWFRTRFPNVTKLTFYCVDHLSVERFVELIQLYLNLEHLVLFSTSAQQIQYNHRQFWTALYGLQSLSHLYLPFDFNEYSNNPCSNQLLVPLFKPNLRVIYCKSIGPNGDIIDAILDPDDVIGIGQFKFCHYDRAGNFMYLHPYDGLTRFGSYFYYDVDEVQSATNLKSLMEYLDKSVNKFSSMTHLDLAIPANLSLLPILTDLARLTLMSHIRFPEQRRDGQQPPSHFFSGLTPDNYRTQLGQPNNTLQSVRNLHLSKFDLIQPSSIFRYFSLICPQIHTLNIEDCTVIDSTGTRTSSYWFLTNVRRFAQLRQVYHNNRLVLEMDRDKDGDYVETDKLVRAITNEIFMQRP